jgi:hypothetical protein
MDSVEEYDPIKGYKARRAHGGPSLPDPFKIYNEKATYADRELIRESNESVDTMLIFVNSSSACRIPVLIVP